MFRTMLLASALFGVALGQGCDEHPTSLPVSQSDTSFLQHSLKLDGLLDAQHGSPPRIETYSLFVKFHKVAGSTWRAYVDRMTGEPDACSGDCGDPHEWVCKQLFPTAAEVAACVVRDVAKASQHELCTRKPHSCTYHQSLGVMRQAMSGQNITAANASDLASLQNLWADSRRFELLWRVDWARTWLPLTFQRKRILVTTLLRDPVERIRSYYYFLNDNASHEGFQSFLEERRDFVSGNMSHGLSNVSDVKSREASTISIMLRSCCEYETWLGDGSVEKSKAVLSTQFDLVALTERMSEGLVSLGKLYGLTAQEVADIGRNVPHELENSDSKLDWAGQELALAKYVATRSKQIYDFAEELFDRQALGLFSSRENLKAATEKFEQLNPSA